MKHLFLLLFSLPIIIQAQTKAYQIKRAETKPTTDGKITAKEWAMHDSAGEFISYYPISGATMPKGFKTEWKATYDNQSIYFAVSMYDPRADSIMSQLCKRDRIEGSNNDHIIIRINPYQDGQTDFGFKLSPLGVQEDVKFTTNKEDSNWDMVWKSATHRDDKGWYGEFEIPYSALRFPKSEVQDWSVNIVRHIRRYRASYAWNPIDITNKNISSQAGTVKGFKNIEPPLRLSFLPYISSYATNFDGETEYSLNGGMDVKYGINESFTLDMTLIPDFRQVGFDNQVLNLSPFEVQYDEKRPFFTEGTELFDKGYLFYSRRISDNLLNATKVTGRTKNNLGLGILNAVTNETESDPLSNYNIVVLDQSFAKNSYLTFTNTNVQRKGGDKANVTGLLTVLRNKINTYQFFGNYRFSHIKGSENTEQGFASYINISKVAGKLQFGLANNIESDTYNPNDMGFLYNNNEFNTSADISYRITESTKRLVDFKCNASIIYEQLYKPRLFSELSYEARQVSTFRNFLTWGISSRGDLTEGNDYFESRTSIDDVFKRSKKYTARMFFSSDYRKKLALDISFGGGQAPLYDEHTLFFRMSPRVRFSEKLFMYYIFSTSMTDNETGYITSDNGNSIFSTRKKQFFTNVLKAEYVLNTKMSFDFKFRHHWEQVRNYSFHTLDNYGYLQDSDYVGENNVNFNAWNIDLNFNYWFAPASEISIVWKNSILTSGSRIESYYKDNLEALLNNPQENSLSLRLRYFLDYQYLKKK